MSSVTNRSHPSSPKLCCSFSLHSSHLFGGQLLYALEPLPDAPNLFATIPVPQYLMRGPLAIGLHRFEVLIQHVAYVVGLQVVRGPQICIVLCCRLEPCINPYSPRIYSSVDAVLGLSLCLLVFIRLYLYLSPDPS